MNPIKLARMKQGLLQIDVARALGVSEGLITRIETGRRNASPELIDRLAALYGVPKEALLMAQSIQHEPANRP